MARVHRAVGCIGRSMAAERACAAVRENAAHSILSAGAEDPSQQARMAAFLNALHRAGWTEGRNLQSIIAVDWVTRPMCADTRRS